jgi:hypothetical protein
MAHTISFEYTALLNRNEREIEIDLKLIADITIENDGIGSYEYCGMKGYDQGRNYVEMSNLDYIPEDWMCLGDIQAIEDYLDNDNNQEAISDYLQNEFEAGRLLPDNCPFPDDFSL